MQRIDLALLFVWDDMYCIFSIYKQAFFRVPLSIAALERVVCPNYVDVAFDASFFWAASKNGLSVNIESLCRETRKCFCIVSNKRMGSEFGILELVDIGWLE